MWRRSRTCCRDDGAALAHGLIPTCLPQNASQHFGSIRFDVRPPLLVSFKDKLPPQHFEAFCLRKKKKNFIFYLFLFFCQKGEGRDERAGRSTS